MNAGEPAFPTLEGEAAEAVAHRGGHIQIIAAAGSGTTEVVAQRVADLIATDVEPRAIVAFMFTKKAAAELKERIRQRVTARIGHAAGDKLGQLQVSTIHAYCFRLLQTYDPRFEAYSRLMIIGEPATVERFVASTGLPSRELDLRRLSPSVAKGAAVVQAASEVSANAGRWMKLTEESARAAQKLPLVKNSTTDFLHATTHAPSGQFAKNLQFVAKPGAMLTNPAILAGVGGIMAQYAMQQTMEESPSTSRRSTPRSTTFSARRKMQCLRT